MLGKIALCASLLVSFVDTNGEEFDLDRVSEVDAINCRLDVPGYNSFALALEGEEKLAKKRHWKKVASQNPFLNEYELPTAIVVAGSYRTRRIAFSSSAIMAILDLADPAVVARGENIENSMDPEPMIAALAASGKASRAEVEAEIKFRKFLGKRVLVDVTEPAGEGESFGTHMTIARSISNVSSHPGKTLYGCSYQMEMLDEDGKPL